MHLLFLSSLLPEAEPATGFEIANRALVEGLEAAGARLTLAGFRRPGSPRPAAAHVDLGERGIENAAATRVRKARWVLEALANRRAVAVQKLRAFPYAELRRRLREAGPADGIVLSSVLMPIAFPELLSDFGPAIVVAHNVEHRSAAENARDAGSAPIAALFRREARLLRAGEERVCARAAVVHALARDDARQLGLAGDPRSIPLPLTVGRGRATSDDGERRFDVVLIGNWSWAPNRAGLDWFVRDVVPRLDTYIHVGIAGRFDGPPPAAPSSVEFLGRVDDAQRFVRSGRVVALATRAGTGVQLKTIETLEEGMPAVATSLALRGIEAVLPGNVRVADEAARFAWALDDLVRRERAGEPLRLDGRAFAERQRAMLREGLARGLALAFPERGALAGRPAARRAG